MRPDHANRFISDHSADSRVTNSEMDGKFLEGQKLGAHQNAPRGRNKSTADVRAKRCRHRDRFDNSGRETEEAGAELKGGINWRKGIRSSTNLDRVAQYRLIVEGGGWKHSSLGSVKKDQTSIHVGEVRISLSCLNDRISPNSNLCKLKICLKSLIAWRRVTFHTKVLLRPSGL